MLEENHEHSSVSEGRCRLVLALVNYPAATLWRSLKKGAVQCETTRPPKLTLTTPPQRTAPAVGGTKALLVAGGAEHQFRCGTFVPRVTATSSRGSPEQLASRSNKWT